MRTISLTLTTKDSLQIAGNYIPGSLPVGIILLHMMPATKESYNELAPKLAELGYHTLAIDFRGHGESQGGDYLQFTHEQHQAKKLDVEAAVEYLHKQNPNLKIGFIGASIGANLSIQYASQNPAEFVVALSPGLNYRGVNAAEAIQNVKCPMMLISARDDARVENNAIMTEQLYNQTVVDTNRSVTSKIYQTGGHGTDILKSQLDLTGEVIEWIRKVTHV